MKIIFLIFACELFVVISARPTFDKIAELVLDAVGESVYPTRNAYPAAHQSSYGYHGGYGGYQYEHQYGEDREGAGYQQQGSYGPPPYYPHPNRYLEPPRPPPAYLPSPHAKPQYGYGHHGNQYNQHNYRNEYSDPALNEYPSNRNYGYQQQPTYYTQGHKTDGILC
ncbi:metacaspase-1-like [Teleopsis dalmanni]|uniref:metacaspase-1-like n=1 Tax=Teleopsis dalmanni TaxID=139649 RepID=UPI0018CE2EBE|nr:metacaspase-1-like [Teleopsis dalmanni]